MWPAEAALIGRWRRRLFGEVKGPRVLEVGVGTGVNLGLYPAHLRVTAVDVDPRMLARARERAGRAGADIRLHAMDIEDLAFPDASFDMVVSTFVVCNVHDPAAALAEVRRVLRPGGKGLFLEHVSSRRPLLRAAMEAVGPLWYRATGDDLLRDTGELIREAGLKLEAETLLFSDVIRLFEVGRSDR
jgi:ubiquinone/menaquinone biosynthesis C-methylase UbiE